VAVLETAEQFNTNDHPKLAALHMPTGMYPSARSTKARPKDSTLTLINGNEISNSKTAESEAPHSGSYFKNQMALAALYGPLLARSLHTAAIRKTSGPASEVFVKTSKTVKT
jgi:hypothetical protein